MLALLAREEAAFDVPGRGGPRTPVGGAAAAAYLADSGVLDWVATQDGAVVGFLLCYLQRRRAADPSQLLLYEVGVRETHRRRGIVRALIAEMERWMRKHDVATVWVLADETAEPFYAACGFTRENPQPIQMAWRLG